VWRSASEILWEHRPGSVLLHPTGTALRAVASSRAPAWHPTNCDMIVKLLRLRHGFIFGPPEADRVLTKRIYEEGNSELI
jgi:hypothetical protein